MNKKFYITTPIYYSSGKPHIGHAYTTIMADCLSKYKKLIGYDTFFLTGMDEHGQKIEETAKKNNLSPQEMIDKNAMIFQDLWKKLDINYDIFMRTSFDEHKKFVQEKFTELLNKKYIYLGEWKSKYCVSCEENINSSEVVKKDNKFYCQFGHELIDKNEESYFLKVSLFKDWIKDFFKNKKDFIVPQSRVNELVNNFIDNDFSDLSISRISFDWGIKINENPKHVVYVWLDALFNYVSALKMKNKFDEFWSDKSEKVHLLSKEITRFHCIYWPIFLKMLDLELPNKIISHGWIITKTGKMSKSLGNVIDPIELISEFGTDAVRYYFMKDLSIEKDSIFDKDLLISCYNSDLANNYGNIVSRVSGMIQKYRDGIIPKFKKTKNKLNIDFYKRINEFVSKVEQCINSLNVNIIVNHVLNFENDINLFIENFKPWNLFKDGNKEELNEFLNLINVAAKLVVWYLSPILTNATKIACDVLNFDLNKFNYKKWENSLKEDENKKINPNVIIFERIKNKE